jgi:hypothetical protein
MSTADTKSKSAIGFLTVVEDSQQGLCGGYLVLNRAGRPLEFHCTVPIRANRAQEILYGPTLAPFLYGEQIGQTLVSKAKCQPGLVCTDREPILAVQDFVATPVVLVLPSEGGIAPQEPFQLSPQPAKKATLYRLDTPHRLGPPLFGFQLGRNQVAIACGSEDACAMIVRNLGNMADCFDLGEPFQRIREAIEEAQKAAR